MNFNDVAYIQLQYINTFSSYYFTKCNNVLCLKRCVGVPNAVTLENGTAESAFPLMTADGIVGAKSDELLRICI